MLALSKMAMVIDSEEDQASVKAFQAIFPSMVAVLKEAIDANDEERIMQAFEVFQTLLGCDYQLMSKHFQDLVVFMNQIAANTDISAETRVQAISFLIQYMQYRRLRIQGMKIGEPLTLSMLQVVTELGDSSVDDDEITPARSALALIDSMAQ
jgi:importin-4